MTPISAATVYSSPFSSSARYQFTCSRRDVHAASPEDGYMQTTGIGLDKSGPTQAPPAYIFFPCANSPLMPFTIGGAASDGTAGAPVDM